MEATYSILNLKPAPMISTTKTVLSGTYEEAKAEALRIWRETFRVTSVRSGPHGAGGMLLCRIAALDPYHPENGANLIDYNTPGAVVTETRID